MTSRTRARVEGPRDHAEAGCAEGKRKNLGIHFGQRAVNINAKACVLTLKAGALKVNIRILMFTLMPGALKVNARALTFTLTPVALKVNFEAGGAQGEHRDLWTCELSVQIEAAPATMTTRTPAMMKTLAFTQKPGVVKVNMKALMFTMVDCSFP